MAQPFAKRHQFVDFELSAPSIPVGSSKRKIRAQIEATVR